MNFFSLPRELRDMVYRNFFADFCEYNFLFVEDILKR